MKQKVALIKSHYFNNELFKGLPVDQPAVDVND